MHEREYKRAGGGTLTDADDVVVMDMVTTYTNQDPAGDEYYATYYGDMAQDGEIESTANLHGENQTPTARNVVPTVLT